MVRRIEINADDPGEALSFGIVISNFGQASRNRIVVTDGAYARIPLDLHFAGRDNVVDLRCASLPHGTIRFFGDDAVFTLDGEGRDVRLDVYAHTGSRVSIQDPKAIFGLKAIAYTASSIVIGPRCLIAENTLIMTSDHHSIIDLDTGRQLNYPADVGLDADVWLGWGSSILKGVTIGQGSIVAAHAVVTTDIGIAELWGGLPARRLKQRVSWVASHPANSFDVDEMMRNLATFSAGPASRAEPSMVASPSRMR